MKRLSACLIAVTQLLSSFTLADGVATRDHFPFPRELAMFSSVKVSNPHPSKKRPVFVYVATSETNKPVTFQTSVEKEKYGSPTKKLIKYFNGGSLIYFEVRGKNGSLIYDDQGGYAYPQWNKLTGAIDATGLNAGVLRLREKTEFGWVFRPKGQLTCAALVRTSQSEWSYLESQLIPVTRLEKEDFENAALCPQVFSAGLMTSIYLEKAKIILIDQDGGEARIDWSASSDLNPLILISALDRILNPR